MPSQNRKQLNSVETIRNSKKIMHVPGAIVGDRYQIIQKLGREGCGKTYLAKDLQATDDYRCALEQLRPQLDSSQAIEEAEKRLAEAVVVLQRLGDHPQIPKFKNYFVEEQQFYLAREYIDGENLEREIKQQVFDEAKAVHLLQDVLRILDFIHKNNVIHLDLKPTHLIRRKQDGNFVLINFGAVRDIEAIETEIQGQIISTKAISTWGYMAPEQKADDPSFSSDIYALGKTVIYALTGRSPQELEKTNINWRHCCQIGDKLTAILEKMVAYDRQSRYTSALEVLYDLKPLLKIDRVVGARYRITSYLGGKAGVNTYLADNLKRKYQSPCSIKQIELPDSNPATWAKVERRFAEELSILERLGYHEQIPQLWDHFEENEEFYLVQEYIHGENLAQELKQHKFQPIEIVQLLENTLSVLAFIHQHGIIHRNIKPSNLIIRDSDRSIVLTDFGIITDIKSLPNLTVDPSQTEDKKNYLPPEQIAGRPTVGSDIYALGMTAIELLTQVKPSRFPRNKQTGTILWHEELNVNRRLAKVIDKMTHPDVGQRYQSAEKVLNDLYKININSDRASTTKLNQPQVRANSNSQWSLKPIHLLVAAVGIGCLLSSLEFAFPTLRPMYYWHQGQKLLSEQQPTAALPVFMKAIDLKPESSLAWIGRGDALFSLERFPEALEAYYEAIQLDADNPESWKKKADTLFKLERFSEALTAYERTLELQPENAEVLNQTGKTLYELQRYPEALEMHEEALKLDRLNARFLSDRARVLMALERYYDALTVLNRVQAIEPLNLRLWQDKVLALKFLNRPQESERVYQEVLAAYDRIAQQNPQNENIWLAKGDFFFQSEMYRGAVTAYERAIEIEPDSYFAWLGKGKALTELGSYDRALTALNRALKIRPQSYQTWQARGSVFLASKNDLSEAVAAYDRAIAINPNFAPLWRERGTALIEQENYARGIESLTKASELNPQDVETWLVLANALVESDRDNRALLALDRALAIQPQDPEIWLQKGEILIRNQQYNEVCDLYRQSRQITPDSPAIMQSMRTIGCRMN